MSLKIIKQEEHNSTFAYAILDSKSLSLQYLLSFSHSYICFKTINTLKNNLLTCDGLFFLYILLKVLWFPKLFTVKFEKSNDSGPFPPCSPPSTDVLSLVISEQKELKSSYFPKFKL